MSGPLDLALVTAFVEVVRHGSFTKAADRLGLPKSTVSRRVTRLEETLGAPLLVRTTRQLRMTEEGASFHARVAPALEEVDDAVRAVHGAQDEPRGHLRVSVPPDLDAVGALVARFVAMHPAVTVEVNVTGRKVDLVKEGYDVAVRAGALADSSLIARKIGSASFRLFASHAYLAEHGVPERVADLARHRCVPFRSAQTSWTLHGPGGAVERVEVSGPVSADDLLFLRGLVLAGVGVGLLPRSVFRGVDHSEVSCVLREWTWPAGAVYAVYPSMHSVPARVRAFCDLLIDGLRDDEAP